MVEWFEKRREDVLVMERSKSTMDAFEATKSDGLPEMITQHNLQQIAEATPHHHRKIVIHKDISDCYIVFNAKTQEPMLMDFGAGTKLIIRYVI